MSDPAGHPVVGRPEETRAWLRAHPDVAAIDGRVSHRLFSLIAQFPAMRASWLRRLVGASPREVTGSNQTWTITVKPPNNGTVTITLPVTTDCTVSGAICTDDGRKLSNSNSVSISGPS